MTEDRAAAAPSSALGSRQAAEARLRALSEIGRAATSTPPAQRLRRVLEAARAANAAASISLGVWQADVQLL